MKKVLVITVAFVLVFLLVSCKVNLDVNNYEKDTWFSKETLDLCLVSDFPIIEGSEFLKVNDENIYVNWEYERYKDYVDTFYEYIKSKHFAYLGTRGEEHNNFVGAFTTYYFEPAQELEEFKQNKDGYDYIFVYSDGSVDEDGNIIFNIITFDRPDKATIKYQNTEFISNTIIRIRHKQEAPLGGRYILDDLA